MPSIDDYLKSKGSSVVEVIDAAYEKKRQQDFDIIKSFADKIKSKNQPAHKGENNDINI